MQHFPGLFESASNEEVAEDAPLSGRDSLR